MNRSPMLVIFVTVFIDLVGFGIVIPILPFYLESEQFRATPRELGLLFASYSVMQLVFTPVLGRLSDRYGRRPVLFFSIVGAGVGYVVLGAATALWMLFVGRVVAGITGGNISTAQAYVADITTPENRARGMGLFGAAFGLGFIFGPALGGLLSRFGISAPFYFAAALSFANAALLYFTLPETVTRDHPARSHAAPRSWSSMLRHVTQRRFALVLLIYFLFVVSFSIMTTVFPLYTQYRFGYDPLHNGYLFAYIGVISAVIQGVLIGRLVRRWGEPLLVVLGAFALAVNLFVLPFVGPAAGGLVGLLALLAAFSTGNSFATPALTSLASKSVGAGEQGGVMGLTQAAASLARTIGPLVGGFLIYSANAPAHIDDRSLLLTFGASAAIMFAALLCALYFMKVVNRES